MTMEFAVCLEYDEQYDGYVASVPSLPGCMSQGKTRENAIGGIFRCSNSVKRPTFGF